MSDELLPVDFEKCCQKQFVCCIVAINFSIFLVNNARLATDIAVESIRVRTICRVIARNKVVIIRSFVPLEQCFQPRRTARGLRYYHRVSPFCQENSLYRISFDQKFRGPTDFEDRERELLNLFAAIPGAAAEPWHKAYSQNSECVQADL